MSSSHHDSHGVQEQPAQCLCAAGCGFYSNVGTGGLCSKCHREAQHQLESQQQQAAAKQQQPDASAAPCVPTPAVTEAPSAALPEATQGPSSVSLAATPPAPAPAAKKPSPTRCWTCNKKVGLTGFSCKCEEGAVFCSTHRYAEAHACPFDYKALAKQQLEAKNPLVQASKVDRI